MLHPSLMFRRSLIPWKDKLWANQAEPNDDYLTLFCFLRVGKFANLPEKLMYYRMHSSNKSMQNVKSKFLNAVSIRFYAWRHLGYHLSFSTVLKNIAQAGVVLLLPESLTISLFFWLRGMKSFSEAFPQFHWLSNTWHDLIQKPIRYEVILPALLAGLIYSLLPKDK
jgi:hypothetical protein